MNAGQCEARDPYTPRLYGAWFGVLKTPENAFLLQKGLDIANVDHSPSHSCCDLPGFGSLLLEEVRQGKMTRGNRQYVIGVLVVGQTSRCQLTDQGSYSDVEAVEGKNFSRTLMAHTQI